MDGTEVMNRYAEEATVVAVVNDDDVARRIPRHSQRNGNLAIQILFYEVKSERSMDARMEHTPLLANGRCVVRLG